jgi:hypothetical protein
VPVELDFSYCGQCLKRYSSSEYHLETPILQESMALLEKVAMVMLARRAYVTINALA